MRRLAGVMAIASILLIAQPARSEDGVSIAPVNPTISVYREKLSPRQSTTLPMNIKNLGDQTTKVTLYVASTGTLVDGGFRVEGPGAPERGAASWVQMDTERLKLGRNESERRSPRVTVPPGTQPGDYYAAVVAQWQQKSASDANGDVRIRRVSRSFTALSVRVPGPALASVELAEAEHSTVSDRYSVVSVEVRNSGALTLRPQVSLMLRTEDGSPVGSREFVMDGFYAKSDSAVTLPLEEQLPTGSYLVDVTLSDPLLQAPVEAIGIPVDVGEYSEAVPNAPGRDRSPLVVALVVLASAAIVCCLILLLVRARRKRTRQSRPQRASTMNGNPQPVTGHPAEKASPTGTQGSLPPPNGPPQAPPDDPFGPPPSGPAYPRE